jgi:hypothetical protein
MMTEKERERASHLVCHNNGAERPFAVVKGLSRLHPNTKLSHLSSLAHARVNGTHASPSADSKNASERSKRWRMMDGAAMTAHPVIQEAVAELFCTHDASICQALVLWLRCGGNSTRGTQKLRSLTSKSIGLTL